MTQITDNPRRSLQIRYSGNQLQILFKKSSLRDEALLLTVSIVGVVTLKLSENTAGDEIIRGAGDADRRTGRQYEDRRGGRDPRREANRRGRRRDGRA